MSDELCSDCRPVFSQFCDDAPDFDGVEPCPLHAAAPELLEALRPFAAREECEIGVIPSEDDDLHNQACGECGTILIARRAIAKAEGR